MRPSAPLDDEESTWTPTDLDDIQPDADDNLREFIDRLIAQGYTVTDGEGPDPQLIDPGGRAVETWREDYPYDELLTATTTSRRSTCCRSSC